MKTAVRFMLTLIVALGVVTGAYLFTKGNGKHSCKAVVVGTLKAANAYQGLALR